VKKETLPANQPDLSSSYSRIGEVFCKINEYSKALSFHEKALDMQLKSFVPPHPDLGTSYNNIGLVYSKTGDLSKHCLFMKKRWKFVKKPFL
jgi:tetratricopeptide (TPR) repeat protein